MKQIEIRPLRDNDSEWISRVIIDNWHSNKVVAHGRVFYVDKLPGFLAILNDTKLGLLTFNIENNECEIITLNNFKENIGIGSALLTEIEKYAVSKQCDLLWVITTNDNINALRFYQKRGFKIRKIFPSAIENSRRLKPEIPQIGLNNIEIRDEIELEKYLFLKKKERDKRINAILFNPTIDVIYEIENFYVGGTFKANKKTTYPVGKAISFSLGAKELSQDKKYIKILACIGKDDTQIYSHFLLSQNIDYEFVKVEGKTRSNKTINDPIMKTTTHIREKGFELNTNILEHFIKLIKDNIETDDFVVFSGSIPPGVDEDIYYKMINICKEKRVLTILDSNGPALINGIKANPNIIKPNLVELSQILNNPKLNELNLSDITVACKYLVNQAKNLLNKELKIILITLGSNGAILLTKNLVLYGNVIVNNVIDTVGSGDSFLAGFVLNYFLKIDLKQCFKYAIACGAANTIIPGPNIFNNKDVKTLLKKVDIMELS